MNKPVLDPAYWKDRLEESERLESLHRAVYHCHDGLWDLVEKKHRQVLGRVIGNHDSILDIGCGYGRLLGLLPPGWDGHYVGIDLSPDFIALARFKHPDHFFLCCDVRNMLAPWRFDWAVMLSFRAMVIGNLGGGVWADMESVLRKSATRLLYLEVDIEDEGSVE